MTVKRVGLQVKPIGKKRSNPSSLAVVSEGPPKEGKPLRDKAFRVRGMIGCKVVTWENIMSTTCTPAERRLLP